MIDNFGDKLSESSSQIKPSNETRPDVSQNKEPEKEDRQVRQDTSSEPSSKSITPEESLKEIAESQPVKSPQNVIIIYELSSNNYVQQIVSTEIALKLSEAVKKDKGWVILVNQAPSYNGHLNNIGIEPPGVYIEEINGKESLEVVGESGSNFFTLRKPSQYTKEEKEIQKFINAILYLFKQSTEKKPLYIVVDVHDISIAGALAAANFEIKYLLTIEYDDKDICCGTLEQLIYQRLKIILGNQYPKNKIAFYHGKNLSITNVVENMKNEVEPDLAKKIKEILASFSVNVILADDCMKHKKEREKVLKGAHDDLIARYGYDAKEQNRLNFINKIKKDFGINLNFMGRTVLEPEKDMEEQEKSNRDDFIKSLVERYLNDTQNQ